MNVFLLILLAFVASPAEPSLPPPPSTGTTEETTAEEVVAWINDDVVLLSELKGREQEALRQKLGDKKIGNADISSQVEEIRRMVLSNLITNRLLIQEAESLYDLEKVKLDLLKDFKDRNQVKSDEELDRMLRQYRMTREDLIENLVMDYLPPQVLRMKTMSDLGVSEAEARAFYQDHPSRFQVPGQVTFRELVLKADTPAKLEARREEAQNISARGRSGDDFSALVREFSEGASKSLDGKIGPLLFEDLNPAIRDVLSAIPPGSVSDPVATSVGWVILKVETRQDERKTPFEEARAECEEAVRMEKNGPAIEKYVIGLWKEATVEVRKAYIDRLSPDQRALVQER